MDVLLEVLREERAARQRAETKAIALEKQVETLMATIRRQAIRRKAEAMSRLFRRPCEGEPCEGEPCEGEPCEGEPFRDFNGGYDEPDRKSLHAPALCSDRGNTSDDEDQPDNGEDWGRSRAELS